MKISVIKKLNIVQIIMYIKSEVTIKNWRDKTVLI